MSTPEYIKGTLENMKLNINLNLDKICGVMNLITNSSRGILGPVSNINDYYTRELKKFKNEYTNFLEKINKKIGAVGDMIQENKDTEINLNLILDEYNINNKISGEYLQFVKTIEKIVDVVSVFNDLFKTNEFTKLVTTLAEIPEIKKFKDETESVSSNDEIKSKTKKRKKFLGRKHKREKNGKINSKNKKSRDYRDKKKLKKSTNDSVKDNKSENSKESIEEILTKIKETIPNCGFISKTFLTRKLRKRIIWSCHYIYSDGEDIKIEKIKEDKSFNYKYIKLSLQLPNIESVNYNSEIFSHLGKYFSNFVKMINKQDNTIIIAGDLNSAVSNFDDFIEKVINDMDLYKSYSVLDCKVEVYAFYEELIADFDLNLTPNNFIESDIERLQNDWDRLTKIREMWNEYKK